MVTDLRSNQMSYRACFGSVEQYVATKKIMQIGRAFDAIFDADRKYHPNIIQISSIIRQTSAISSRDIEIYI